MTFKIGDTVRCLQGVGRHSRYGHPGQTAVVTSKDRAGNIELQFPGQSAGYMSASRFELVTPAAASKEDFSGPYRTSKVVKTWIIAVLSKDGKPQPNTNPAVYSSEKQAETVAKEMAKKHPGETFMVFQGVAVAAQPKVVEVELVRL